MRQIAFVLLPALALTACQEEEAAGPDTIRAVRTMVAEVTEPVRTRAFPSVLEPPEITPLAFDVGGRLGPLGLRVGQDVERGEVIATVEAADATLNLQQAQAALSEAEAAATNARQEADRQKELFTRNVVSEATRDSAVTAAEQADARVDQARRSFDLLNETLADTELRAPFNGVISGIEVQAFGSVQAGEPVVTLYEDDGLQATMLVSYNVASTLALGQPVSVRPTDGAPEPLPATVTEIARRAPAVSSFPVVVTLDTTRPDLRSGMAVEILVEMPVPNAERGVALPLSAIAFNREVDLEGDQRSAEVFVYEGPPEEGHVTLRGVEIGAVIGSRAYVVEGLAPGERVATAGVPFLHDGQAARLEGVRPDVGTPSGTGSSGDGDVAGAEVAQ